MYYNYAEIKGLCNKVLYNLREIRRMKIGGNLQLTEDIINFYDLSVYLKSLELDENCLNFKFYLVESSPQNAEIVEKSQGRFVVGVWRDNKKIYLWKKMYSSLENIPTIDI